MLNWVNFLWRPNTFQETTSQSLKQSVVLWFYELTLGALSGLLPGRGEEFSELKVWLSKVSWGHHACLAAVYRALRGGGLALGFCFGLWHLNAVRPVNGYTWHCPALMGRITCSGLLKNKKHASKLWRHKSSVQNYHADSSPLDPRSQTFAKDPTLNFHCFRLSENSCQELYLWVLAFPVMFFDLFNNRYDLNLI